MQLHTHSMFVGLALLAAGPVIHAEDAGDVFRRREAEIRASEFTDADDYTFVRVIESVSRDQIARAFSRAELRAKELFLLRALGDPKRCVEDSRLTEEFVRVTRAIVGGSIDARGLQVVFRKSGTVEVEVVCAIPRSKLQGQEVSCEDLLRRLSDQAAAEGSPLSLRLLAYEYADADDSRERAHVLSGLAARSPCLIDGKAVWEKLPEEWFRIDAQSALATTEIAFERAASRPGDRQAMEVLLSRLVADGYVKSSRLLALPPALPSPVSSKERSGLESEVRERINSNTGISAKARIWIRLLSEFGDALPVAAARTDSLAAAQAFASGELERCISSALDDRVPSPADWNLVSVCLRESMAPHLAIAAARVARRLQPGLAYAQVNELLAARALGLRDDIRMQLEGMSIDSVSDEWSRRNLRELADWALTPPPASEPDGSARASEQSSSQSETEQTPPIRSDAEKRS